MIDDPFAVTPSDEDVLRLAAELLDEDEPSASQGTLRARLLALADLFAMADEAWVVQWGDGGLEQRIDHVEVGPEVGLDEKPNTKPIGYARLMFYRVEAELAASDADLMPVKVLKLRPSPRMQALIDHDTEFVRAAEAKLRRGG